MVNLKPFITASALSGLLSGVTADILERWQQPLPSCNTTDFVYAGCFTDLSTPSALLDRTDLPSGNMTIQICIDYCKGNGYKYAGLEYYGECFCGSTVNGPETAESNCTLPCGGDQTEVCGGNDIISVYQDTTFPTVDDSTIADYSPMGCYTDLGPDGRTLAWRQDQLSTSNLTIEECLFACKDGGYAFAGVEYAQECYCGVVLGNGTNIVNSTECAMPCTGNADEICGGPALINLYFAKDLESTEQCINGTEVSSSTSSTSTTTSSSSFSTSSTCTTTSSSPTTSSTPWSTSSTKISSKTSTSCTTSSSTKTSSTASSTKSTTSSTKFSSSTTSTTTTKSTASLCTSTTAISATPTCEYQCGSWCSKPLPSFNDQPSCLEAYNTCNLQIASCFSSAGWPNSAKCSEFSGWCSNIFEYCFESCPGNKCSVSNCKSQWPPSGPTPTVSISTVVYTCTPSSTSKSVKTTSTKGGW